MGFFDNFKEKATDLMQAGAAQSKRLAEIAKLKTAIEKDYYDGDYDGATLQFFRTADVVYAQMSQMSQR